MATYTTNYNLEKPAQTDIYNVDVFNANADKIDAGLTDKAEKTMLAPVETTNSASRSYAKGEYFVYNNVLCCATTAIAAGGTIAIGTNCSTAPVGGELKSLRDALSNCLFWDVGQRMSISIPVTAGNWAYKNAGTAPTKAGYSFIGYYCVTMNSTGVSPSYQKNSNDIWVYGRSSGTATIVCEPLFVKST